MKRLTLIVSGNVQQAGYRDRVIDIGKNLGLKGYAENLPDGSVKVVAEGEENKLELFRERANIKNALINVEKIEDSLSEATGEFFDFSKLVSGGETDERLDRAAELLKELIVDMNKGFNSLNNTIITGFNATAERQDKMLEKQDRMLEKQDTTIHILERVSEDTSDMKSTLSRIEGKQDKMLEKQDRSIQLLENIKDDTSDVKSTLSRIEVDVKDTRFSLSSFIEEKFQKQEGEIAEIKATLARMQAEG